ncbi:methyltransferase domain-containing protein [Reichenbachiella carrageenanivorans]|uniref:Methyltransferase domain-containing protein n=1 Tax=Reichenbachiella carrageenanivorans TaxID=2979869 RepID=A0ABY6D1Y3_9BACT|nr:class I SAM-dependent methyltransferase [Reichenbachiella carrageenanivorans]UXX80138.1 methyltransferase domain-containing protein [Reichenbachiella carrageenanivorans]
MNNYNRIAWFYDTLAHVIFGGRILHSQKHFLHLLKAEDRVLILGGGAGQVLVAMDHLKIPLTVDFIEPSRQMMKKAQRRVVSGSLLKINYCEEKFQHFETHATYDCVCCFYFLDLFNDHSLTYHLSHISKLMKSSAILLLADFQILPSRKQHAVLSRLMHLFFRITTKLESNQLKDIRAIVAGHGFDCQFHTEYFHQFIFSAAYRLRH